VTLQETRVAKVFEEGAYVAAQIPEATMHEVPDAGHWLLQSHFAEILDRVNAEWR
jgi:hypothetical protein